MVFLKDMINDLGNWGPKCLYAFMNTWVPLLSVNIQCNDDGKLLTSRADMKNILFYITLYSAKKQGKNHSMSAILAKGLVYHTEHASYSDSLHDQQCLLLFHLIHTINQEQQCAGPMVVSYLMGWGDTYGALLRAHPSLSQSSRQ